MPTDANRCKITLLQREQTHCSNGVKLPQEKWDMENDGNYNNKIVFIF